MSADWGVTESGREAKFYTLTPEGSSRLDADVASWKSYVEAMARVLNARQPSI